MAGVSSRSTVTPADRATAWDVIVVGAGPAGCAAAAAARQADPVARVLLLDRTDFPRDKVCGDGIAAQAWDALRDLGFDTGAVAEGYPSLRRLRLTGPGGPVAERDMAHPVHVVPRRVFDARLVADVTARGVELRRHRVTGVVVRTDGVEVDGLLRARAVIGADGAESLVRRAAGVPAPRSGTVAVALRGYAPVPADARTQMITMTDRRWPAYAWNFPVGDGTANVGYGHLLDGPPVSRAEMAESLHRLLPDVGEVQGLRGHRLPLSTGRPRIPDGRVLLVGDAQSLIHPLTGEGIYYAIVSGALAGGAAVRGARAGAVYRRAMRHRLGRHLRHTSLVASAGRWPAVIDAGVRSAARRQRSFDDLVHFGLADGTLRPRMVAGLVR
ncbi:hypothetical protein GCM10009818_26770 [Nakamurella flavida]